MFIRIYVYMSVYFIFSDELGPGYTLDQYDISFDSDLVLSIRVFTGRTCNKFDTCYSVFHVFVQVLKERFFTKQLPPFAIYKLYMYMYLVINIFCL